jgi:alpha-ketoglutarate-dependent 2,4-dichlorophenoxyacetate dioxygenase
MEFEVRPLTPKIGAEIRGLDLSEPLPDEIMAKVRKVWLDRVVAVFPEQDVDDDQHIEFSKQLGDLELINMAALQMDGRPEIFEATNLDANDNIMMDENPVLAINRGNQKWHSDSSFKTVPATASMLHAYIVPKEGGETEFANMAAAYDALEDETKQRCEGLIAIHDFYWSRRDVNEQAFTQEERDAIPPVRHPLIRVHPETGRKAIYVGSHTREIEGWDFEESRTLIDSLIEHGTRAEFTYRHEWNAGDMVLWDNRAVMHRGTAFEDQKVKRRLHRTTIAGTGPTL